MKICDCCGCRTAIDDLSESGIILCQLCLNDERLTMIKIIAELESEGIDVISFLRQIYAFHQRNKMDLDKVLNCVPTKEDGNTCNMRDVKRVLLDNGLIPTPVSNDETPATSPIETFTTQEVQSAISYFLEYGEMQFGKSQCGYFSGDGWAARALRFHLGRLKSDNRKCDEILAQEL